MRRPQLSTRFSPAPASLVPAAPAPLAPLPLPAALAPLPTGTHRIVGRRLLGATLASLAVAVAAVGGTVAGTHGHAHRAIGGASGRRSPSRGLSSLPLAAQGTISAALGGDDPAYRVRGGHDRLSASNDAQHLRVSFARSGVLVSAAGARLGLALSAVGYGTSLHGVGAASPGARGNRVVYTRGALREWYANGPLGLEQGFSVQRQLAAHPTGPLTLSLAQSGDLHAVLAQDGRAVLFDAADGRTLLRYDGLAVSDARGHKLHAWLSLRETHVLVHVDARGARYPLSIDPIVQNAELSTTEGAENSALGYSVAVSGTTIAVGAEGETVKGDTFQGAVYVFSEPASGGYVDATQTAELTASDGAKNDGLGYSVAVSGSTIVAGGWLHEVEGHSDEGAVYVFAKPASGPWVDATQTAELTAKDGATLDELGFSVAVSGSTIVAGARYHTVNGHAKQGAVYVFSEPSTGGWVNATQTAELTASDGAEDDYLGASVAVSGSTILAGSELHTVNGHAEQGAVYVFSEPSTSGWVNATQTAELTASDGAEDDELGSSVALSGATILAGAPGRLVNSHARQGAVYVFSEPSTGGWVNATQTAELTASDGAAEDELGTSVAVSGSTIVAGAPHDFTLGLAGPGRVYVFAEPAGGYIDGTTATQTAELTASADDSLGFKVGSSGSTIVAGVPFLTVSGHTDQGVAYVYDSPLPSVTITTPAEAAVYTQGQAVTAEFTCTAGAGEVLKSGEAGCSGPVANGAAIDTSAPGTHTFTVTATDVDGQTGTATNSYTVTPQTTSTEPEPAPETTTSSISPTTSVLAPSISSSTGTPPPTGGGGTAAPKVSPALACTTAQVALINVVRHGSRVLITGAARQVLVGKRVSIRFLATGKTVASTTIAADGSFSASAPLPPAKTRETNLARYEARVGSLHSLNLKLARRMYMVSAKRSGAHVLLSGYVTGSFRAGTIVKILLRVTCSKEQVIAKVKLTRSGKFSAKAPAATGAASQIAVYRGTTSVLKDGHPETTYTLPTPTSG